MTSLNFTTLLNTLDTNLNREAISTKKYGDTCSWTHTTTFTVTYTTDEETTITNCIRICLLDNNGIQVYINHHNRQKLTKIALNDITALTIGAT